MKMELQNTAHKLRALDLISFYFSKFKKSNRVLDTIPLLFEYLLHYSIPNPKPTKLKVEEEEEESESDENEENENEEKIENNNQKDEKEEDESQGDEEQDEDDDIFGEEDDSEMMDDKYRLNPEISNKIATILVKLSKKDQTIPEEWNKENLSKVFFQVLSLLSTCNTPAHKSFLQKYFFPVLIFLGRGVDSEKLLFFSRNSSNIFKNIFSENHSQSILERILVHFPLFSYSIVESLLLLVGDPSEDSKNVANFFDIIPHILIYAKKSVIFFIFYFFIFYFFIFLFFYFLFFYFFIFLFFIFF